MACSAVILGLSRPSVRIQHPPPGLYGPLMVPPTVSTVLPEPPAIRRTLPYLPALMASTVSLREKESVTGSHMFDCPEQYHMSPKTTPVSVSVALPEHPLHVAVMVYSVGLPPFVAGVGCSNAFHVFRGLFHGFQPANVTCPMYGTVQRGYIIWHLDYNFLFFIIMCSNLLYEYTQCYVTHTCTAYST